MDEDVVFQLIMERIKRWSAHQPEKLVALVVEHARRRGCECHECIADSLGEHTCSIFKVPRDDPAASTIQ